MTDATLTLRHLCFTGPRKPAAGIEFHSGLNVIYGASETGKSFILEAIDFMLGSKSELRDIGEWVGYDRIFLGLEDSLGQQFTLERSTAGGNFLRYEGLHFKKPAGLDETILKAKHNPTQPDSLSRYLLSKIGLDEKRIRKNVRGETDSLSFRNLVPFCMVGEQSIQKASSPLLTGQPITATKEYSVFKLLLTGVDDSAITPEESAANRRVSRGAKIEVIDEFIEDQRQRLTCLVGEDDNAEELQDQLEKLVASINREQGVLNESESAYRGVVSERNLLRVRLQRAQERQVEIDELLSRFALLDKHYGSDLERLEGIREAGSLAAALDDQVCPLCGTSPEQQHKDVECDGNIDAVVASVDAERSTILTLQRELQETVTRLRKEAGEFEELVPDIERQLEVKNEELSTLSPLLSDARAAYTELLSKRTVVQNAINILKSIEELEERKIELEAPAVKVVDAEKQSSDLSQSTLNEFSKVYEEILQRWNFPDSERVHFDTETRDFVISGKPRGARGKGMRAITHAAFNIALLDYTERESLPHPGFVVLDTPLLAYREPESEEVDLRETNVHECFFNELARFADRQIIVLENVDPPSNDKVGGKKTFFSKSFQAGRYGLFPVDSPPNIDPVRS